jgi:hypothetical protein
MCEDFVLSGYFEQKLMVLFAASYKLGAVTDWCTEKLNVCTPQLSAWIFSAKFHPFCSPGSETKHVKGQSNRHNLPIIPFLCGFLKKTCNFNSD